MGDAATGSVKASAIVRRAEAAGLAVAQADADALAQFLNLLERWNRVHNLTAIEGAGALIDRHVLESLALVPLLAGARIADVGSGAGVPGLPLAIVERARHFTLIESRAKRVAFLRHVVGALGLMHVEVSHGRVEDLRSATPFDTVLARAVAPPATLLPLVRHLTGPGSRVIVLAGPDAGARPEGTDFRVIEPAAPAAPVQGEVLVFERVGEQNGASRSRDEEDQQP